ncbi:hypothetical protein [Micromonospora sp. NPDC093277]|uniref:hypothetical protein n=1 Tax=Micromonospora sp. NPDC093277 TaxID=3364291 RepID=UPI0037FD51CA
MMVSGRLPRWDTWFPDGALDDLLPDPGQRSQVLHRSPELPWKVVAEVLPTPGRAWHNARRSYLQLSAANQATAEQAEERGYRVRRMEADYLALVTQPAMVSDLLLSALRT